MNEYDTELIEVFRSKLCGRREGFNHVALFVPTGTKPSIRDIKASAGINTPREPVPGVPYDTHAEKDALTKFMRSSVYRHKVNEKGMKIDLIVLCFTASGQLRMSKPCNLCIKMMSDIANKKKIIVKNVYYSTRNGTITKEKFGEVANSTYKSLLFRINKMKE